MNKDKQIKDLKERNNKLKHQYQLKEIECINNQYKADKYKKVIDKTIEYIKEKQELTDIDEVINTTELLNILKGKE